MHGRMLHAGRECSPNCINYSNIRVNRTRKASMKWDEVECRGMDYPELAPPEPACVRSDTCWGTICIRPSGRQPVLSVDRRDAIRLPLQRVEPEPDRGVGCGLLSGVLPLGAVCGR